MPNALVALRFFLAIPIAWLVAAEQTHTAAIPFTALLLFVVGVGSDVLDGAIARRSGTATLAGEFLDPLADTVLVLAVLLPLAARLPVVAMVTAVIVARESAILSLRLWLARRGTHLAPSPLARLKTGLLFAGAASLLFAMPTFSQGALVLAYACLVAGAAAAVLSALGYLSGARRALA